MMAARCRHCSSGKLTLFARAPHLASGDQSNACSQAIESERNDTMPQSVIGLSSDPQIPLVIHCTQTFGFTWIRPPSSPLMFSLTSDWSTFCITSAFPADLRFKKCGTESQIICPSRSVWLADVRDHWASMPQPNHSNSTSIPGQRLPLSVLASFHSFYDRFTLLNHGDFIQMQVTQLFRRNLTVILISFPIRDSWLMAFHRKHDTRSHHHVCWGGWAYSFTDLIG
jgi:hypothetical protein